MSFWTNIQYLYFSLHDSVLRFKAHLSVGVLPEGTLWGKASGSHYKEKLH
jgi:hypothetical protein